MTSVTGIPESQFDVQVRSFKRVVLPAKGSTFVWEILPVAACNKKDYATQFILLCTDARASCKSLQTFDALLKACNDGEKVIPLCFGSLARGKRLCGATICFALFRAIDWRR